MPGPFLQNGALTLVPEDFTGNDILATRRFIEPSGLAAYKECG
jgi:hypothetical protein